MAKKEEKQEPNFPLNLQIDWKVPENIVRRYATNMVVQTGENEIFVSFFETVPPLFIGSPEEIEQQASKTKTIPANCVAAIVISPEKIPSFVDALQEIYARYKEGPKQVVSFKKT